MNHGVVIQNRRIRSIQDQLPDCRASLARHPSLGLARTYNTLYPLGLDAYQDKSLALPGEQNLACMEQLQHLPMDLAGQEQDENGN